MTFLTPWPALLAGALAIPLLLLLYFLKLRRRMLRVPSTLLWPGVRDDLQVNVPFQRLRYSILLLLQLLILLCLLLALGQPVVEAQATSPSRLVLIIDRSASMSTVGPDGTNRLDAAKEVARRLVEQAGRSGEVAEVMIIAFADSAQVVSEFQSQRRLLLEAIEGIAPSDGPARLEEALQLAEAFSGSADEGQGQDVQLVLLSDGGVEPPGAPTGFVLQTGEFRFAQIREEQRSALDNVGIVSFSARRQFEDPGTVLVFARLVQIGREPVTCVLTLRRDGAVEDVRRFTIPGMDDGGLGEASATFALEAPGRAVISLEHDHRDQLAVDDSAVLVLPEPGRARIALVHGDQPVDPFVKQVLELMELRSLDVMSVDRFRQLDPGELDAGALYDLVVFDRVSPSRLPGVPTLTLGAVPNGITTVGSPRREDGHRLVSWQRDHPLMRHVELDDLVYAGFDAYQLPAGATPLAFGTEGPVIASVRSRGAEHVLVGFELPRSNWPLQVSFAVFMANLVDHLTIAGVGESGQVFQPGDPITVRAAPRANQIVITGPQEAVIGAEPGRAQILPALERVGLYDLRGVASPNEQVAVSLLSDTETDIRPREELVVNARSIRASRASEVIPRALWPLLVAIAGALMVVEWLIYCARMRR